MKKKLITLSSILLISIAIAGGTFAWFYAGDEAISSKTLSTIEVQTIETNEGQEVKNTGTGDAYVRVRLVPQWSDPNLSVGNINLDISNDWELKKDGYYYYQGILKANKSTGKIINSVKITGSEPEYEGQTYNIKVVSEGVQTNKKALKAVWGINSIP